MVLFSESFLGMSKWGSMERRWIPWFDPSLEMTRHAHRVGKNKVKSWTGGLARSRSSSQCYGEELFFEDFRVIILQCYSLFRLHSMKLFCQTVFNETAFAHTLFQWIRGYICIYTLESRNGFHWLRFKVLGILHFHEEALQEVKAVLSTKGYLVFLR